MKLVGTCWDETLCSVDVWNPFQTRLKPVLVCSVDRAIIINFAWTKIIFCILGIIQNH